MGNAIADKMAERAAIQSELDSEIVKQVLDLYALTQSIQLRHVAILTEIIHEAPRPNYPKHEQPVALPISFYVVRSMHTVVLSRSKASCAKCFDGAVGLKEIKFWLCTPCCGTAPLVNHRSNSTAKPQRLTAHIPTLVKGAPIHSSHSLFVYKGFIYCAVCGFYAAHAVRKLKAPCGEGLQVFPTQQGLANLARIKQGLLPAALSAWPADAPSYLSNLYPKSISTSCASGTPLLTLSTT